MIKVKLPEKWSCSDVKQTASTEELAKLAAQAGKQIAKGDKNPFIDSLVDVSLRDGSFIREKLEAGKAVTEVESIDLDTAKMIVAVGGDVIGLPVWFVIDEKDIGKPCPFGDGKGTWETWGVFGESHKPTQIGDKWYRSNCVGQSGEVLHASAWVSAGLVVITKDEFVATRDVDDKEPKLPKPDKPE